MSNSTVTECHGCGKQKRLVHITAEDIQRTRPPSITMVCEECRDRFRRAARLEASYSTGIAVRDLVLMIFASVSLLLLWSNLVSGLRVSFVIGTTGVILLVPAVVSFSGLRVVYVVVGDRYGFTHDLAWSLHARYAMMGLALLVSGILAVVFHSVLH